MELRTYSFLCCLPNLSSTCDLHLSNFVLVVSALKAVGSGTTSDSVVTYISIILHVCRMLLKIQLCSLSVFFISFLASLLCTCVYLPAPFLDVSPQIWDIYAYGTINKFGDEAVSKLHVYNTVAQNSQFIANMFWCTVCTFYTPLKQEHGTWSVIPTAMYAVIYTG
jgi:hypothetical protein